MITDSLGVPTETVTDEIFPLVEEGRIDYIVYTGAWMDSTVDDYIALHRRALAHSVPCFTSLDTAHALADSIACGYNESNTELVDICHMRTERGQLHFSKMQASGDDYIYIENFDGGILCPESLCVELCDRHRGIGGFGIVLIEHSDCADAAMRIFNSDGTEGATLRATRSAASVNISTITASCRAAT